MSLHLITGLPRNGKSYYCVTRMLDDLELEERLIYTNLSINPDYMAKIVCSRLKKTIDYLDLLEKILYRIRIFRTFTSRKEIEEFRRLNPLWCRLHRNRGEGQYSRLLYPFELLVDYWNYTRANSLFYLDECYQIWNCLDSSERSSDAKEKRKELQNYMRMHGHDGDDIYLITHKERDLDKFILDTLSYRINVRNSKYWPIIPQEILDKYWWLGWLASLRWPIQFFILRSFIGDEALPHRSFCKRCDSRIFKCYDSQSRPNGLRNRGYDGRKLKSSDINTSYLKEFLTWLKDSIPALLVLFLLITTVYGVYSGLRNMLKPSKSSNVASVLSSVPVTENKIETDTKIITSVRYVKIKSISSVSLIFDDGQKIKKGGKYVLQGYSFDVLDFNREFLLLGYAGRFFRYPISQIEYRK